jgi:hypothetical protein
MAVLIGCQPNEPLEGQGLVPTAVSEARSRGDNIEGFEVTLNLMLQAGRRSLTDAEVSKLVELAKRKDDRFPARMSALEAISSMGRNGDKERARQALDRIGMISADESVPSYIRALHNTDHPQASGVIQSFVSSPNEEIASTARLYQNLRKEKS